MFVIKCGKVLVAPTGIGKKNKQKAVLCEEYFNEGKLTVKEICERFEISRVGRAVKVSHIGRMKVSIANQLLKIDSIEV